MDADEFRADGSDDAQSDLRQPQQPTSEESVIAAPSKEETDKLGEERSISADLIRGHINTIILRSLYDGDKYGYEIIAEIERKSHGQYSLKQPSLYSALKRLEKEGYITSYWGGSVGGGRRKYFSLSEGGKKIAEQNQSEWEYSRTIIDSLISDKDFDFDNPAPSAVNMRMLKETTSRVRTSREDDEMFSADAYDGFSRQNADLETERETLEAERRRVEEELLQARKSLEEERARLDEEWKRHEEERVRQEEEWLRREEALNTQKEEQARQEEEWTRREEELRLQKEEQAAEFTRRENALREESERLEAMLNEQNSKSEVLASERETYSEQLKERDMELKERDMALQQERSLRSEEILIREQQIIEERQRYEQIIQEQETALEEERKLREQEQRIRENAYEAERERLEQALAEQEKRIREEQEEQFRQRERELLHANYLNLVNAPPMPEKEGVDYNYYTKPIAEEEQKESPESTYASPPNPEREYRTVVRKIYDSTVEQESPEEPEGMPLGNIDFRDLSSRAAQDGIRITTSGGKYAAKSSSVNLVNRGKALFLSSLILFFVCIVEGSLALAVQAQFELPLFYPYFIWGVGMATTLITGVMYANHYGDRSVRRPRPVIIDVIVIFAVIVIVIMIIALAVNIDFKSLNTVITYIAVPIIFFFGIVIFGISYYVMIRPKK